MLRDLSAKIKSGMPLTHAEAFQDVANKNKCVISVRVVGKYATHLLLENYISKGFHNKAKSCTWGPMAGFVLADPRFTKNPDRVSQRNALQHASASGANEIPLFISDERRKALEGALGCMTFVKGDSHVMEYKATSPKGDIIHFILKDTLKAPGAEGKRLWAVFYGEHESRLSNDLQAKNKSPDTVNLLPVMAIVDPDCPPQIRHTYRSATTCDYDLWAIFPLRKEYSRSGKDQRKVPESDRFRQSITHFKKYESPDLGNITPRISTLVNTLNYAVYNKGYRGGKVVHHGDEAGRPSISNIDFPCIFYIPHERAWYAENVNDFKSILKALDFKYVMGLNPGWYRQLGINTSMRGNYEV